MTATRALARCGCGLLAVMLACSATATAQQASAPAAQVRTTVTINVRGELAIPLALARVEASVAGSDTVLRTDTRGRVVLNAPVGTMHLRVTVVGYGPDERIIVVEREPVVVDISMSRTTQTLAGVDVVAKWIGVRGVVVDNMLTHVLPGTSLRTSRGGRKTTSDSAGRFELALADEKPAIVVAERAGYVSRSLFVHLPSDSVPNVTVLMTAGKTSFDAKRNQIELRMRTAYLDRKAMLVDRSDLGPAGLNLQDAFLDSKSLAKHGLRLSNVVCIFEDGFPKPALQLSTIRVRDVDFIEVYGRDGDHTELLKARWRGDDCSMVEGRNPDPGPSAIRFINIWLRH